MPHGVDLASVFSRRITAGVARPAGNAPGGGLQEVVSPDPGWPGVVAGNMPDTDVSAAGWGWVVRPTPSNDGRTNPGGPGEQARTDRLAVLVDEPGQLPGRDHGEGVAEAMAPAAGGCSGLAEVYVGGQGVFLAPPGADELTDPISGRRKGW